MKGIFRKAVTCAMAGIMVFGMTACGKKLASGEKILEINIDKMAYSLINGGVFNVSMTEIDDTNAKYIFNCDGYSDIVMYDGAGGASDELIVVACKSESDADNVLKAMGEYVKSLQNSFKDYDAVEYDKAGKSIQIKKGKYVVMCISDNQSRARDIISDVFEGRNVSEKITSTEDNQTNPPEGETAPTQPTIDPADTIYADINTDGGIRRYEHCICVGNTAYENYEYDNSSSEYYANVVNAMADKLSGVASVYDIVIPICIGLQFPTDYTTEITVADQNAAIEAIGDKMNSNVKFINIFPSLAAHKSEYLYYRTDHHWSGLAAYYAYVDYCSKKGITAHGLNEYQRIAFPGFLGSFAIDTQDSILLNNPDTVTAFYPLSNDSLSMTITDANGNVREGTVIYDETNNSAANKYGTYIMGDNPLVTITNASINDGSACVVIKESFGNAMVPFLTDHYQTVYVIDYRYWTGALSSFVAEKGIQDVLYVNNISMVRGTYSIGQMAKISQ